jgi:hypothetical protein
MEAGPLLVCATTEIRLKLSQVETMLRRYPF